MSSTTEHCLVHEVWAASRSHSHASSILPVCQYVPIVRTIWSFYRNYQTPSEAITMNLSCQSRPNSNINRLITLDFRSATDTNALSNQITEATSHCESRILLTIDPNTQWTNILSYFTIILPFASLKAKTRPPAVEILKASSYKLGL